MLRPREGCGIVPTSPCGSGATPQRAGGGAEAAADVMGKAATLQRDDGEGAASGDGSRRSQGARDGTALT